MCWPANPCTRCRLFPFTFLFCLQRLPCTMEIFQMSTTSLVNHRRPPVFSPRLGRVCHSSNVSFGMTGSSKKTRPFWGYSGVAVSISGVPIFMPRTGLAWPGRSRDEKHMWRGWCRKFLFCFSDRKPRTMRVQSEASSQISVSFL
jgi:hypothetical protein